MNTVGLDKLKRRMELLPARLKLEVLSATHQTGKHIEKAVKARFKKQGPGWKPLSPAYARWRRSVGLGSAILLRTSKLYHSIQFVRSSYTGGFVGVADGYYFGLRSSLSPFKRSKYRRFPKKHFRLGREQKSIPTVAKIHEHGLGEVPARPFFGPTAIEVRPAVKKIYHRALVRALKK